MGERRLKIVAARPPNYDEIVAAFPQAARMPGVIFAYGFTIYNPSGNPLSPSLVAHEHAHAERQQAVGGPDTWWRYYIADKQFCFDEEVIAHRAEWRHFSATGAGRNARRAYLSQVALRLASPLYGKMISASKAKVLISE